MKNIHTLALNILKDLGRCPATPFNEYQVANKLMSILEENSIAYSQDDYGNIVAKISGTEENHRPIAYVAHMDHPGYEIIREEESFLVGKSLGGVPRAAAIKGADCFSFDQENNRHPCRIEPWADGGEGEVKVVSEIKLDVGTPITFNLPDFTLLDNQIEMRALDDLAGCASIMASLIELNREPVTTDIYGIFTRAEEVGLVGAGLIAVEQTIPSNTFVVSVETSSVIPGVEQGMGPVIRTGDASYTFDAEAENILALAKKSLLTRDSEFKCQRQLMAAGSCEATAFAVNGYSTTGIAFPLGNWHNATTKIPDPEGGVSMEYISLSDFLNGTDLIFTSAFMGYSRSSSPVKERLLEVQDRLKDRLKRRI